MIQASKKVQSLPGYAFAEMDRLVAERRAEGIDVIDFGTGDPRDETPKFIREAAKKAVDTYKSAGYPSYQGMQEFLQACASWYKRRFGVVLDPKTEIMSTIGSKEAVFNFPEAFIDPGDIVIMPTPGYPPYSSGTLFAEGMAYRYPLLEENDFYPDFEAIGRDIESGFETLQGVRGGSGKAKIFWLCYPNSPTGKIATRKLYEKALAFCQKHGILLASDECYVDLYFGEKAPSALEVSKKGLIVFHSLSKRNNMTGYRVGFCAGDPEAMAIFKKFKPNVDSGTPNPMQQAAIAALLDEEHVEMMRSKYRKRRDIMLRAFQKLGLKTYESEGTFYIWQKVPEGYDSISFAKRLLQKDCGIAVTPGLWLADDAADAANPGKNYVRLALVENDKRIEEAAGRLSGINIF